VEKIEISSKRDKNNGYFNEHPYTFLIKYRSILLRVRHVSDKTVERITTYIICSITLFFEIMWNNIVQPGRPQMAIQYGTGALHAG
jgi:hypothetical protein